jgi:hypothetical protein
MIASLATTLLPLALGFARLNVDAPLDDGWQDITVEGVPLALRIPSDWRVESHRNSQQPFAAAGRIASANVDLFLLALEQAPCLPEAQQQLEWFYRAVYEARYRLVSRELVEQQGFPVARLDYELSSGERTSRMIVALFAFGDRGAAVQLGIDPEQLGAARTGLDELLASVRITAAPPDRKWNDREVQARLRHVFPDRKDEQLHVTRTAHYLVLSEAAGGERLGDRLEDQYVRFREFLPFVERATDRLMPVYLFADQRGYEAFASREMRIAPDPLGGRSLGHAGRDYYATGTGDPDSRVHAHEAAHQLAKMRLSMVGGGSWLHEGLATYFTSLETRPELAAAAKELMARKESLPWRKLMTIETLYTRSTYMQAASIIAFFHARDEDWPFLELMERLGEVALNDVEATEQVLLEVTGRKLDDLEQEWIQDIIRD